MIIFNGKNSEKDFNIFVASKELPPPTRKVITETVPYMSGLWDFSYHDSNEDEYEAVTLKYSFDVIADSKQDLNRQKTALLKWIHAKTDGRLYDSDISLNEFYSVYHAQAGWNEDDLQAELSVDFTCYPFRRTEPETVTIDLNNGKQNIEIFNKGMRSIMPIVTVQDVANIKIGNYNYSIYNGTYNSVFVLEKGTNILTVEGLGMLTIEHWAEVL